MLFQQLPYCLHEVAQSKAEFSIPVLFRVEASHANAHARAIAFFSYIWFKYDILSWHCCKLRSVMVIMLSYQPSAREFDSRLGSECAMQYAGTGKEMHEAIFFLLQSLALKLWLRQGCQPEGIAIT